MKEMINVYHKLRKLNVLLTKKITKATTKYTRKNFKSMKGLLHSSAPVHCIKLRTLNSLTPQKTRCQITCFGAQGDKVSRLAVGLALHIFATQCRRVPKGTKQLFIVAILFISSCHVGVSKRFSRSISLAIYCLSLYIFLADQISCTSYVGSIYRRRSLAVSGFSFTVNIFFLRLTLKMLQ